MIHLSSELLEVLEVLQPHLVYLDWISDLFLSDSIANLGHAIDCDLVWLIHVLLLTGSAPAALTSAIDGELLLRLERPALI